MQSNPGTRDSAVASSEATLTLALLRLPGIGSLTLNRLLNQFETAQAVFAASGTALRAVPQLPGKCIQQILAGPNLEQLKPDLQWLTQPGHTLLEKDHPHYPAQLLEIYDPPPLLFADGNTELLQQPQLAIVGSRNATPAGIRFAQEISEQLAEAGLTITSGMATGIDSAAHRGALMATNSTIAVIGTGADRIYPTDNHALAAQLSQTALIVSEYPIGTPPLRENFPRRNRIISGLSLGVLVIEAGLRSGSLITARLALEQGREVFAVPGSVRQANARGCHRLIKQGAKLTEELADVIEELPITITAPPAHKNQPAEKKSNLTQQKLLEAMGFDPISMDQLVQLSGLTAAVVSSMLLQLEVQGVVAHTPGGLYQRSC